MVIPLMGLIIALIVFAVLFWAVRTLIPLLGLPAPLTTILYVLLVLIFVLYLVNMLGGFSGHYGSVRIG